MSIQDNYKSVAEAFASSVPNSLIESRIREYGDYPTEDAIDDERDKFNAWILERYERFGIVYTTQADAWKIYTTLHKPRRHNDIAISEDGIKYRRGSLYKSSWEEDIIKALEDLVTSVTSKNYSELYGQL